MKEKIKIGVIICDRYRTCAGGKCFRALKERAGAFEIYRENDVEIVGYTTCGGCPGGNIEYAPEELKKNGANIIHFATGMVVGYPPCPYLTNYKDFIQLKYGLKVVIGTHPIPQKYYLTHKKLGTWNNTKMKKLLQPILKSKSIRLAYD